MPDHVEDMKAGRVVVSELQAGGSCVWYYEDGLLKNQVPAEGLGRGPQSPRPSKAPCVGKSQPVGTCHRARKTERDTHRTCQDPREGETAGSAPLGHLGSSLSLSSPSAKQECRTRHF